MPIYEYECEKCGKRFEYLQRIDEEPKKICPCGKGGKLRRVLSAPAIRFKGSGWYVTDYAGKNSPSEPKKAPKESGGKEKSED